MNPATLTSTQFNILDAPVGGTDLLNKLIYKNNSVSEQYTMLWSKITLIGAFLFLFGITFCLFGFHDRIELFINPINEPKGYLGYALFIVASSWFTFSGATYLYKLHLYFKFKSIESISDDSLPSTTVIVSANNEGKQVYDTLVRLAKSDYPEDKLQLLAIDNGSNDDTWSWMHEAKNDLGDRVTIIQQSNKIDKNQAVNHALSIGIGEIFVTVDTGAIIAEDTLRNLVSSFVVNKKRGIKSKKIKVIKNEKVILA